MARTRSDIGPRIIEAARERFLREGVDGASLRAIAADAGTNIGMVYYYFPTKDDLFFAAIEDSYEALVADLARVLAPDSDVPTRLHRLYQRLGAMTAHEITTVRLIMREALVSSERLDKLLVRFQRGHIPLILATIRDGIGDGTIAPDLPPVLVALVTFALGAVPQFVLKRVGGRLPIGNVPDGPALGDLLVRVLLQGIAARQPRPRSSPATDRSPASEPASTARRRRRSGRNPSSPRGGPRK